MEFLKQLLYLVFCRCFSICFPSTQELPEIDDDTVSPTATSGNANAASSSSGPESSATTTPTGRWTYDSFLSFRGEDTRNGFVDHLYTALDRAGIYTFKDDEKLPRGKLISPELLRAIEESMVSVVVFSKNYANSSWCLDELAKIIECHNLMGQRVLPVFYDVDPSYVRGQKGSFHTAFQQHEVKLKENMEKMKRWREVLTTAANLSGWDVPKTANGREAECIKQIVSTILSYSEFHRDENIIGMESRIREVKSLLGKGSHDVYMIGIWGMGGIGKTTLARDLYNQISYEFEGSSFVEDVRENGCHKSGLKSLQEKLLSEILMEKDITVKDCDDGKSHIRRRLRHKKVLLVLDDVDDDNQLECLYGDHEWFGPGSRIIITTRNKHLISFADKEYAPELLHETEAMWLFSRYAFKANNPPKAFVKLSAAVVHRTGHLPLALKVLGSHFRDRDLNFWESALDVLAAVPNKKINDILKLSFDGLDVLEKEIFLDIACFFKGKERDYVTRILDSFGFRPVSGITVLVEKSLLTVVEGKLHMHDLIQDMGRSIARECNPNNRVWLKKDMKEAMTTTARLETVEAIVLEEFDYVKETSFNAEVFKSMKKLRLLDVTYRFTLSEPTYFPDQLQWLRWFLYPFESLNITTDMTKLVSLHMPRGRMKQLQMEKKLILNNLKFINLHYSRIRSFPDVSGIPNLEGLNLSECDILVDVDQSVWLHERIIHLNLSWCSSLEILPTFIEMKSLETLNLNGCFWLERFPDISGIPNLECLNLSHCRSLVDVDQSVLLHERIIHLNLSRCDSLEILSSSIRMKSLKALNLNGCCSLKRFPEISGEMGRLSVLRLDACNMIKALPSSIRILTSLIFLSLSKDGFWSLPKDASVSVELEPGFERIPRVFTDLTCLRILDLKHNNLVEDDFPSNLHDPWPLLEELNLSDNIFTRLPATISHLSRLKYLNLSYCHNLEELYELPSLLQVLDASYCESLQKIGDISNKYKWLFKISLHGCPKLLKDQDNQSHLDNLLVKSLVQKCAAVNHRLSISVPESKIPNWFTNQQLGNMIALNLPQNQIRETIGLAVSCLFGSQPRGLSGWLEIKFIPTGKEEKLIDRPIHATAISGEHVWIGYMPTAKSGERVWIGYMPSDFLRNLYHDFESKDIVMSFEYGNDDVLECGVCVVYKDDVEPITTIGSCIQDYDKVESFLYDYGYNFESASSEDLQHRRWSEPTFSYRNENAGGYKAINVRICDLWRYDL